MFAPVALIRKKRIVALIRKRRIIKKLWECKAFSPETAVTFEDAGIINPHMFKWVTQVMIKQGTLVKCGEKYYLNTIKA